MQVDYSFILDIFEPIRTTAFYLNCFQFSLFVVVFHTGFCPSQHVLFMIISSETIVIAASMSESSLSFPNFSNLLVPCV